MAITATDIDYIRQNFSILSRREQTDALSVLEAHEQQLGIDAARSDFLVYAQEVWPEFIAGAHHRLMADKFNDVLNGKLKRLIINMPPRHTKSEFASHLLISYALGKRPNWKIIQCANKQELASKFGRDVRDTIAENIRHQVIFPKLELRADNKAANRWTTRQKGEYFAIGVDGKVTGRGADLLIIDDPHDEQEARSGDLHVYDTVFDWYQAGPRQRLQPGAAIIIVMTRWAKRDLTGRLVNIMHDDPDADQWEVITLPAILDEHTETERAMWPQYWPLAELRRTRASILDARLWQGPYQQEPTSSEGSIIKADWWQTWSKPYTPTLKYVILSIDTAMTKSERADYSAWTAWGIFETTEEDENGNEVALDNALLLDAYREKCEYPRLKKLTKEFYDEHRPDTVLIETKNTGTALLNELRLMDLPVEAFNPVRGREGVSNDKVARANMVTALFSSGRVWAPETRFAKAVVQECADFDTGDHDDYVDSTVQALLRLQSGGLIRPEDDGAWNSIASTGFKPYAKGAYA